MINIFTAENLEGRIDVAGALASGETAMYIYDVGPGEEQSPYHYEYTEEWLLVVDGTVVLRDPDGERTLERGDLVCFESGPGGAHQIINRSGSPARTLLFSGSQEPFVAVYPDSNTIGVWPGNEVDEFYFRRDSAVTRAEVEES